MQNYIENDEDTQSHLAWYLGDNIKLIHGKWYYGNTLDGYTPMGEVNHDAA